MQPFSFEQLCCNRDACDIAGRARETVHDPKRQRISDEMKDYWDFPCRGTQCAYLSRACASDHVRMSGHDFRSKTLQLRHISLGLTAHNLERLASPPSKC